MNFSNLQTEREREKQRPTEIVANQNAIFITGVTCCNILIDKAWPLMIDVFMISDDCWCVATPKEKLEHWENLEPQAQKTSSK